MNVLALKTCIQKYGTGSVSAMALSLDIKIGGSLWSAVAWNRFGSPFGYSDDDGRKPTAPLVPEVCRIFR
jgi:hypothetical protein